MAFLLEFLEAGAVDSSGVPVALGRLYTYEASSDTQKTVYSVLEDDGTLSSPLPQGSLLDAGGRITAYSDGPLRVRIEDANGSVVYDIPVVGVDGEYADEVRLRNRSGYVGTGSFYTGTTVDGALQSIITSTGGTNARYLNGNTGGVARYLKNKLSEVFDVQDFGALGGGTNPDTSYVTAAITAMAVRGGGTLYFSSGTSGAATTYVIDGALTMTSLTGVRVIADGNVIIRQSGSNFSMFNLVGCSDVTFSGLRLQGGGSTASTVAVGIAADTNSSRVSVINCRFSGSADGTGFTAGVYFTGSDRCAVDGCSFERLYGTAGSYGVLASSSASGLVVSNCVMNLTDGAGTRATHGINVTAMDGLVATGNFITGGSAAGIIASSSTGFSISGNRVLSNSGPGISVAASTEGIIDSNTVTACQDGILVTYLVTTRSARVAVTGNTCDSNTRHGIHLLCTTSTASTPSWCNVTGNVVSRNAQIGILFAGAEDSTMASNFAYGNSTASSGTYPALKITTVYSAATHYGGYGCAAIGNTVTDDVQSAALDLRDGNNTTRCIGSTVTGNTFARQSNGITIQIHATPGVSANARINVYDAGDDAGGGDRLPWVVYTTGTVLRIHSGRVITNQGASGTIALVLPLLVDNAQDTGLYYDIIAHAVYDITVTSTSGQTIIRNGAAPADTFTITGSSATGQRICRIIAIGVIWYVMGMSV